MRWWPLPWPKRWREEKPPRDEEEEEQPKTLRESLLLFARDLIVAFIIVALVLGAMTLYTRVWPPAVVVESDSMQHSNTASSIGVIDTGDMVLVQAVGQRSDVTTYLEGSATGYSTYSNYGDVIVYHPLSSPLSSTPIIHRAMVYVVLNGTGADIPELFDHPAGSDWSGTAVGGGPATEPRHLQSLTLLRVQSWPKPQGGLFSRDDVTWNVGGLTREGFLTKGDHNPNGDNSWGPAVISRIIGKARGELPWFGLVKLTLSPGESGCCPGGWGDRMAPANSWDALLVSLVAIVVGPFAADFGWAYFMDWRKAKRKEAKATGRAEVDKGAAPPAEPHPANPPAEPPTPTVDVTDEAQTESVGPGAGGP